MEFMIQVDLWLIVSLCLACLAVGLVSGLLLVLLASRNRYYR